MIKAPNVGSPREITPGRIVLTAVDFDGEIRWQTDVGEFVSAHGFCSCPILYENLVILNGDHDGESYLIALEQSREKWFGERRDNRAFAATSRQSFGRSKGGTNWSCPAAGT